MLNAEKNNRKIGAFIAEALQSCGGQIIYPKNYLNIIKDKIHKHGGLVIIDEVQTGFGRVGQTFWAHQMNSKYKFLISINFLRYFTRHSYYGQTNWKWLSSSCCSY